MRSIRIWLASLFTLALSMHVAAAAGLTSVTLVQSSQSMNFVPIYIAQTDGYFRDAGLKVEVVLAGGGPKAMTALVGGGGQFSASVLMDGIMAHRRGLDDVRALATLSYFLAPVVVRTDVAKKRGITLDEPLHARIKELKGLRIGITTPGASSDLVLRYLLLTNGFQPDRFLQIVPVGGVSTMIAALKSGQIDGCSCLPSVDTLTEADGSAVSILDQKKDLPALDGVTYGTLYGLASYIKTHPAVANGMLVAIARAERLIAKDPAAAKRATRPYFKQMSEATFTAAWKTYFPDLPTNPLITRASFAKELAFEKKVLPPSSGAPVPYSQVVDRTLAQAATRGLGN